MGLRLNAETAHQNEKGALYSQEIASRSQGPFEVIDKKRSLPELIQYIPAKEMAALGQLMLLEDLLVSHPRSGKCKKAAHFKVAEQLLIQKADIQVIVRPSSQEGLTLFLIRMLENFPYLKQELSLLLKLKQDALAAEIPHFLKKFIVAIRGHLVSILRKH